MAISVNFEALLIGIGVFIFVCVLTFTLFYPFRAGFSEFSFLDRTPRKSSLSKLSKKEFLKRKRKPKKRTEQDDDGISESSLASADTGVVISPTKPVPDAPPPKSLGKPTEGQKPKSQAISTKSRETPLASSAQPEEPLSPVVVGPMETRDTLKSEVAHNGWATEPPLPNFECIVEPADGSPQPSVTASSQEVQRPGKSKRKSHKRGDHVNALAHNRTHNMLSTSSTHAADFYSNHKNGCVAKLSTNLSVLTDMQTKVKYLEKALKQSRAELKQSRQETATAKSDFAKQRLANEEISHTSQILKAEISELRELNSDLNKEKQALDTKVKSLDLTCCNLRSQLNSATAEVSSQKSAADKQITELHLQLCNAKSKLFTSNSIQQQQQQQHQQQQQQMPSSKELLRLQNIMMAMSNENQYLKSHVEQMKEELRQVRQTSNLQQQEIQTMRNKEEALETSRLLLETERTKTILGIQELSARSAALENQLQQCTSELKRVNQRNHEFGTLLTSLQKERSQLLELDRQKSKVIDSLNYQFLELNAEKQRLAETVLAAKTSTQGRVSELQARLATVETELAKAVQEVTSHRRRADVLAVELEELRACLATQSQEQQQQQQQQPTCSAEVSSTSAPMTADEVAAATSEEPLRLDDAAPAVVGTAAKELVYSKSGPNKAKDQQALLQTTLVNTENTLARLQRSIEEEEAKWRHLLLESEKRNANLKRQLEAIKTNSVKAEDGLSDLDGDLDDDSLVAVDSPLTPEGRLNGSHRHQKTMDASL